MKIRTRIWELIANLSELWCVQIHSYHMVLSRIRELCGISCLWLTNRAVGLSAEPASSTPSDSCHFPSELPSTSISPFSTDRNQNSQFLGEHCVFGLIVLGLCKTVFKSVLSQILQGSRYLLGQWFSACFVLKLHHRGERGRKGRECKISTQSTQNLWSKKKLDPCTWHLQGDVKSRKLYLNTGAVTPIRVETPSYLY